MRNVRVGVFSSLITVTVTSSVLASGDARTQSPTAPPPATRPATPVETAEAVDLPLDINGATGDTAEWLKGFTHKPERFRYTVRLIMEDDEVRVYRVTFASPVQTPWPENNTIPAELYLPKKVKGKIPAAIVLDILHGSALVQRGLARGMAEQGAAGFYVPMACYGARKPDRNAHHQAFRDDPSKAIENVRQTVMDVRRAKAILTTRPEV